MPSDTFRMLICGNSGSGKTNLLYHMLIKPLLYYDKIYLYARNLEQDKYKRLIQKMRELSMKTGYDILHVSNDEITPVTEMDYEDNQKLALSYSMITSVIKTRDRSLIISFKDVIRIAL